jgi:hypothetical protein
VLLLSARIALAAPPEAAATRQVELIVGATAGEARALEPSVREMLAGKGLTVVTTRKAAVTAQDVAAAIAPPAEETPSVARVLLDFTAPGQATLFLIDPRRGRVYVRRMVLARGLDAVARASVRLVIEQSVDAILEGREIGVSREEFQRNVLPPASAPPPPPAGPLPPPPARAHPLLLSAGYEGVAMGSGTYEHAAKIELRLPRLHVGAAARVGAPLTIAANGVEARLWAAGVSAFGAASLLEVGQLSLNAAVGVGLDVTRVEPTVTTPDLQPVAPFWAAGPSVQAFAEIARAFGRVTVTLAVGAEAHLLAEQYTVRAGAETRDVFVPSRVRPAGALLVGFAL